MLGLDRRTRHLTVQAEHAAIPQLRPEAFPAILAVIKELAGVLPHSLYRLMPTPGASDDGFRDHISPVAASSPGSSGADARARRYHKRKRISVHTESPSNCDEPFRGWEVGMACAGVGCWHSTKSVGAGRRAIC